MFLRVENVFLKLLFFLL